MPTLPMFCNSPDPVRFAPVLANQPVRGQRPTARPRTKRYECWFSFHQRAPNQIVNNGSERRMQAKCLTVRLLRTTPGNEPGHGKHFDTHPQLCDNKMIRTSSRASLVKHCKTL